MGPLSKCLQLTWDGLAQYSARSRPATLSALCISLALTGGVPSVAPAQTNLPAVSSARAVALFAAICGSNLPNFKNALRTAAANQITFKAKTGTTFSTIEDLSVKVFEGPGAGKTCSMVFKSNDSKRRFLEAAKSLSPNGKLVTTTRAGAKSTGGLFEGKALFFVDGPSRADGKKYFSLKMLSQR